MNKKSKPKINRARKPKGIGFLKILLICVMAATISVFVGNNVQSAMLELASGVSLYDNRAPNIQEVKVHSVNVPLVWQ